MQTAIEKLKGWPTLILVVINQIISCEYDEPTNIDTMSSINNFFRKNSIHNDVKRTLEDLLASNYPISDGEVIKSDRHKVSILIHKKITD